MLLTFQLRTAGRDIVKYLVEKKVSTVEDFNWVAQLRYYWRYDNVGKLYFDCQLVY